MRVQLGIFEDHILEKQGSLSLSLFSQGDLNINKCSLNA